MQTDSSSQCICPKILMYVDHIAPDKKSTPHKFIGEGDGTLLQYSCLENPMDGAAWCAAVHEVAKSWTRLSDFTFTFHFHALGKEMTTHTSVLAWRSEGRGNLVGCCLWGRTESDATEVT